MEPLDGGAEDARTERCVVSKENVAREELKAAIETALQEVRIKLGTKALAAANDGIPIRLSGSERSHAATVALDVINARGGLVSRFSS